MKPLNECRLYGILDLNYVDVADMSSTLEAMIRGGVDLIQLRAKKHPLNEIVDLARTLHRITSQSSIPLIVNDHAEVVAKVPVEGVHVGQEDDSIAIARTKAGRAIVVG